MSAHARRSPIEVILHSPVPYSAAIRNIKLHSESLSYASMFFMTYFYSSSFFLIYTSALFIPFIRMCMSVIQSRKRRYLSANFKHGRTDRVMSGVGRVEAPLLTHLSVCMRDYISNDTVRSKFDGKYRRLTFSNNTYLDTQLTVRYAKNNPK